ncbi:exo-alpha-sialidase [Chitinophaga sp. Cy-1792]|uniref:sialidase family protein n=1 Tax=Chitinophaga sp. Cy-1792 TaxID=2608339 RepID=UPI0014207022|nr:sialidase family protein [Chitinophaga sp. Cy-1792]NIG55208.1 exo-alpha-sialidase [Chitinophaga sp. Cy-1792]
MNRNNLLTLLLLCVAYICNAQPVTVYRSGTEGYKNFRIPVIVGLPDGKLLAFAEGRVHNAGDFGDINIVMKTSTDNGKSWSPLQVVVDNDTLQAGNAAPVMDLTDPQYPKGRLFLFYNTGNNHEGEVRKGKGLREVWYITSTDAGKTWSSPVNITTQVHRPLQPQVNAAYNFPEDWRSYANTPGHGLQFSRGKYRGRIYIAANHSAGAPQPHFTDYIAHGYYTDDHGKTFHLSDNIPVPGSNESTAAELADGRLMFNTRNQRGDKKMRIVALSNDGGATWASTTFDERLPDPVCEGSLLNIGWKKNAAILAFSNCADTMQRNHLTIRISNENAGAWPVTIPVAATDNTKGDFTAYSDLVLLKNKQLGILYEKNGYTEIVFDAYKIKP